MMVLTFVAVLISLFLESTAEASTNSSTVDSYKFPEDFLVGVATSAYQIEGAWNVDGKGENIWDHLLHNEPNFTRDGRNADVADNSYYQYEDDINAVSNVEANMYRISISWTRILPTGYANVINKNGIDYYNKFIDSMIQKNIQPLVTIYHFDLPQELQKLGGWANPVIIDIFVDYAQILFENFGDRVKHWVTFNEPNIFSTGYASTGNQAPNVDAAGIGDYLVAWTVPKAHARVWNLYDKQYRQTQKGKVGMVINCAWQEAATNSALDKEAAERVLQFRIGLWAHPIYTEEGDYPKVVRERVDENSKLEGRKRSRLPSLTPEDVQDIRGKADFLGITYYSSTKVSDGITGSIPSMEHDMGANISQIEGYPFSDGSNSVQLIPWGLRKILNWISSSYSKYPIMILENGCTDSGTLQDYQRIAYYGCHMAEVLRAIHDDKVNVTSYTVWSIVDNFEWASGYVGKYGIYQVNNDDPLRQRIPKVSASFIKQVYSTRTVPQEYLDADTSDLNSICYTATNGEPSAEQQAKKKQSRHPQPRGKQQRQRQQKPKRNVERAIHGKRSKA